ncbi:MAG: aminotransferase class IV [Bacteroidales bacterium]|jgi:D-alanine transaminase
MDIVYLNGKFLPADQALISPEDRGFLFADGVYEVVRWYQGFFFDIESHLKRLARSLSEIRISWPGAAMLPDIARELVKVNDLFSEPALVYIQVTRGTAPRSHAFPPSVVKPTVYSFARRFRPDDEITEHGINVILRKDIRWSRCDIKSISLLPNVLKLQEAVDQGSTECIFVREGIITEGSHSNIFFLAGSTLVTHPESEHILSGITRKHVLKIAHECAIPVLEKGVRAESLNEISEAFITNTSSEIAPVISIDGVRIGQGVPGPVTNLLYRKFGEGIDRFRG